MGYFLVTTIIVLLGDKTTFSFFLNDEKRIMAIKATQYGLKKSFM
jgi:hypothetical protein